MKSVYLDYAATTPVDIKVKQVMQPYFSPLFGNPSEIHKWGQVARQGIDHANSQIAKCLNCRTDEIIFTSSATESINLAHKGLIEAVLDQGQIKKPHIITTQIEHKAVLETCAHLEKLGWATITYLPVDKYGKIYVPDLKKAITHKTVLISIMYVNNEVGTIQPITEISTLIRKINVSRLKAHSSQLFFHTDATQAIPYQSSDIKTLGVDLLSFTGHKIYAPKGIGVLFVRSGTPLIRQQDGGSQENNLRAGTENVPYIVGLGKAIELITKNKDEEAARLFSLQHSLVSQMNQISGVKLTGHSKERAPHIVSFIIEGVEGESMLLLLSDLGIAISTGSACTSQSLSASHVLTAMGVPPESSHGSLRISLGKETTQSDITYAVDCIKKVVAKLRAMAPDLSFTEIALSERSESKGHIIL